MFKELLKAKRMYFGKTNCYPTAVKMNLKMWTEFKQEGKALSANVSTSFSPYPINPNTVGSVNGLLVYIDEEVKTFEFGYHYADGFNKEVF